MLSEKRRGERSGGGCRVGHQLHKSGSQPAIYHHQLYRCQLGFVGTNAVSWSAFTYLDNNTIFMSEARSSLNTQTFPWAAQSSSAQSQFVNNVYTIPPGAYDNRNFKPQNTIRGGSGAGFERKQPQ